MTAARDRVHLSDTCREAGPEGRHKARMTHYRNDPAFELHPLRLAAGMAVLLATCVPAGAGTSDVPGAHAVRFMADPVVVTARASERVLSQTPGSIAVLHADEVAAETAVSVPDLLNLVPGVIRSTDSPWSGEVNIRGLSRESVIFLIDGCRVNTATDINARFGLVDPLSVQRLEILKGPVSSLYGSGSVGGIVNVMTRTGRFTERTSRTGGFSVRGNGNTGGFGVYGFMNLNSPSTYVHAGQSFRDHGSYRDGDGNEVRNSQYEDNMTKVAFGHKVSPWYTVEVNAQFVEARDVGIPGSGTAPLPSSADVTYPRTTRRLVSVLNTWTPAAGLFEKSSLNLYMQSVDRRARIDNFPEAGPLSSVEPRADHDTLGARWLNALQTSSRDISAGIDVWERRLRHSRRVKTLKTGRTLTDQPLPNPTFVSAGCFVEDDWAVSSRLVLNAGARVDVIDVENEANALWDEREATDTGWNVHLGGTWELGAGFHLKALAASGYRAASMEERYQYLELGSGITKWGNPDLDPERSRFVETGIGWRGLHGGFGVSAFYNRLEDMIGERYEDAETLVNDNVDQARLAGVEAETEWRLTSTVLLYGNAAYTSGRDTRNHEDLPDIAPFGGFAGVRVGKEVGPWATLESSFAARQDDVPRGARETPGWATLDLGLGWRFREAATQHSVFLGVDNLLDKEYRTALATSRGLEYNEPGRTISAGYDMRF